MTRDDLAKAIDTLEEARQWPGMFMHPTGEASAQNFLSGFGAACYAFGVTLSLEHRRQAAADRGWSFPSTGPAGQMRERGYTEAQVVDELIAIEIQALEVLAETIPE